MDNLKNITKKLNRDVDKLKTKYDLLSLTVLALVGEADDNHSPDFIYGSDGDKFNFAYSLIKYLDINKDLIPWVMFALFSVKYQNDTGLTIEDIHGKYSEEFQEAFDKFREYYIAFDELNLKEVAVLN